MNFAAQSEVAPSWEHPEHWFETNYGLWQTGESLAARQISKRYLHVSSPEATARAWDTWSKGSRNPSTPYAASKAAADWLLAAYPKQSRFSPVDRAGDERLRRRQQFSRSFRGR